MFLYIPTSLSFTGNIGGFIIEQIVIEQEKNVINMFVCFQFKTNIAHCF